MKIGFDLDGVLRRVDMPVLRCMHDLADLRHERGDENWTSLYDWYYGCLRPHLYPQDFLGEDDEALILTAQP